MTKEIQLSRARVALVDDEDFEALRANRWSLRTHAKGTAYATAVVLRNGIRERTSMHRFVMGAGSGQLIDHINGDGLDNRKANLRFCDKAQNAAAQRRRRLPKSGFRGVEKWGDRFAACMSIDGRWTRIGLYDTAEEASVARQAAMVRTYGEFAPKVGRDWLFIPNGEASAWPPSNANA